MEQRGYERAVWFALVNDISEIIDIQNERRVSVRFIEYQTRDLLSLL